MKIIFPKEESTSLYNKDEPEDGKDPVIFTH